MNNRRVGNVACALGRINEEEDVVVVVDHQHVRRALANQALWTFSSPILSPLVPARRATWPNGEWGYSTRRHMLQPVRLGGDIRQGVVLTDLQSLIDC